MPAGSFHFGKNIDAAGWEAHDPRNSRRSVFATRYGYRCGTAERKRRLIFDYCHAARIAVGGRASDSLQIVSFVQNPTFSLNRRVSIGCLVLAAVPPTLTISTNSPAVLLPGSLARISLMITWAGATP
jgi:hypothetical protein